MPLLLAKTRNLTWQDHTMNVEVMSSANHSTLLLNKHKTLNTSYCKDVEVYGKQIRSILKDLAVEKRLMERYRSKLITRQNELMIQRTQSAQEFRQLEPLALDYTTRSKSAPVGPIRGISPPRHDGRRSRGVFLTEIEDAKLAKLPAIAVKNKLQKAVTIVTHALPSALSKGKGKNKLKAVTLGPKRYVTFGERPPPSESTESAEEEEEDDDHQSPHPLEVKIKTFLDEVKAFNERPVSQRHLTGSADLFSYLKENEDNPSAAGLPEKRYNSMSVDRHRLEAAFDSFCKTRAREDLVKMMRLAAKMKSSIAQSRNAPFVPTMAVMKSTRAFLSLRANTMSRDAPASPT